MQQLLIVVRRIYFFPQRETEGKKKWERKNQPNLMNFILDVLKQRITKSVKREREREHTHTHTHTERQREN
jgi:predicted Rdx family selenoprotein